MMGGRQAAVVGVSPLDAKRASLRFCSQFSHQAAAMYLHGDFVD
jgi:hypothetical protein